jgi:hypothetical protein
MTFAAAFEDPPRAWGVGRVVSAGGITPWPVSQRDIDDEAAALAPRLAALGLGDGGLILIVSLLSQAIHVVPLEQAAGLVGARYSSADATPFDAFRTVSLVRQLRPTVVLGIDRRVCDGIEELGRDLGDVFEGVGAVVAADRDAAHRLGDAGIDAGLWLRLGPTSVIAAAGEDRFSYDPGRWQIDQDDGELVLTSVAARLTPCDRLATGWRGQVLEPGRIRLDA